MNSVVARIQKLLELANSDNENEAKLAASRAQELLVRYNLSMQTVQTHQNVYVDHSVGGVGLTVKGHHRQIAAILEDYFFVRTIVQSKFVGYSSGEYNPDRTKSRYQRILIFVGTKENTQVAAYIFSFLNGAYPRLWAEYKKRIGVKGERRKSSYYLGLTSGIIEAIKRTRFKVEQETGLVVVKDKNLADFMANRDIGTYGAEDKKQVDARAFLDGVKDGQNVTIAKPLGGDAKHTNLALGQKEK